MPRSDVGKQAENHCHIRKQILDIDSSADLSKSLDYNLDGTLHSVTDAQGSKTMSYSAGKLVGITGTGVYPSKTFTYDGDVLTGIVVT